MDQDEPPGRSAYIARAALDSVVLQQFADLLARRPPKRPPSDVPRPEIDEKLIHNGLTPLHIVCGIGDYDLAELLLRAWAVVDAPTLTGATPLHCASHHGHASIVKLLLQVGADVNRAMSDGRTPMWFASSYCHADVVRVINDWAAGID